MAKRFTDTKKRRKAWYQNLPIKLKVAWDTICDECDHAGIWDINMEILCTMIGEKVTLEEMLDAFGNRVVKYCDDKLYIPSFILFQYSLEKLSDLNPSNKNHLGVIRILKKEGLLYKNEGALRAPIQAPYIGAKDKYKEKEKEKEEEERGIPQSVKTEWEATLKHYGRIPNWARDEVPLFQLYQIYIKDWSRITNAIIGFRYEQKTDKYNPARYITLKRLKDRFEYLEGLGEVKPASDGEDDLADLRKKYDGDDPNDIH